MTPQQHIEINLDWIARRCVSSEVGAKKLPAKYRMISLQKRMNTALEEIRTKNFPITTIKGNEAIEIIKHLFAMLGMLDPEWQDKPSREMLPMLALLPGIGCRIVFGKSNNGAWMIEGPHGLEELRQLPSNAIFTHMRAPIKAKTEITAMALFKATLTEHKTLFMQAGLASLLINSLAVATSLYSMQIYDRVIPTNAMSTLTVLTIGVGVTILLEFLVKLTRSFILERTVKGMDLDLSNKIFSRLLSVRIDQFPASVGSLASQVRSYETIRSFASTATLYVSVDAPFAFFFAAIIFMIAGPVLAGIPLIALLFALVIGYYFHTKIEKHTKTSQAASNKKLGVLVETVESAEILKANGSGWQVINRWDYLTQQSSDDDIKIRHYSEMSSYISAMAQQISYVALIATGAWIASSTSELTSGGIIACSILSGRVLGPIASLPGLIVQWGHAKVALANLERMFKLQTDNHEVPTPLAPEIAIKDYKIENIKFAYPGRPSLAANFEKLEIHAGDRIAIVGTIGAGKSTLLKLLAGLFKSKEGKVLFGGLEIQQISRSYLSEQIGYVPQDVRLISGTIRENLTSGLYGVSEESIMEACAKTGLNQLLASHPKGLDLPIAEGGQGVSGGQRQLVALTRLMLYKPSVLLLDEPAASMDDATEMRSMNAILSDLSPDRTLVMVTHKQSLLRFVSRIIVLTPNGIAMDGPRDAVIQKLIEGSQKPVQKPTQLSEQPSIH